jgi:hypothetical protein
MSTTIDLAVPSDDLAVPSDSTRTVPADLSSARDLHERLNSALDDLGLSEVLPPRWATPARSGFFFAPHNLSQAARLVDALERIGGALSEAGIDGHELLAADRQDAPHRANAGTDG